MDNSDDAYGSPDVVAATSLPQLQRQAGVAAVQLASIVFGFGLAVIILAWANFYGAMAFTFIAAGVTLLAYASTAFFVARVHILKYRGASTYMFVGVAITTVAMAFIVVTDTGHLQHYGNPFAAQQDGSAQGGSAPGGTKPDSGYTNDPSADPSAPPNQALDLSLRPQFTADEQMLTGAFKRTYDVTGMWPASISLDNGVVLTPAGTTGIAPMDVANVIYRSSTDRKTFMLTLLAADGSGVTFNEATGAYSYTNG